MGGRGCRSSPLSLPPSLHHAPLFQPTRFAGLLICLLPPTFTAAALPHLLEALFVAMLVRRRRMAGSESGVGLQAGSPTHPSHHASVQEVELHFFSPQTIAVAALHIALDSARLSGRAAATLGLLLACRALHVDPASVHLCAQLIRSLSDSGPQKVLPQECVPDTDYKVAAAAELAAALLRPTTVSALDDAAPPSGDIADPAAQWPPITAGRGRGARALAALHRRTLRDALALEAELRGADPLVVNSILAQEERSPLHSHGAAPSAVEDATTIEASHSLIPSAALGHGLSIRAPKLSALMCGTLHTAVCPQLPGTTTPLSEEAAVQLVSPSATAASSPAVSDVAVASIFRDAGAAVPVVVSEAHASSSSVLHGLRRSSSLPAP